MKKLNTAILSLLLCNISSAGFADLYGDNYNNNNSYYQSQRYEQYNTPTYNHYQSEESGYKSDLPVRFFIGLNAPIIEYSHIKASTQGYSEEHTNTKINNAILENTGLTLGLDTENGFRVSLLVAHKNTEDTVNNTETEQSQTNIGLALDVPFVKAEKTSPFIRLGIEYTSADNEAQDIKASGFGYFAGLGVTHNFTNNLFGILSATYEFGKPDVTVSGDKFSYKQDLFGLSIGLGYRF